VEMENEIQKTVKNVLKRKYLDDRTASRIG
jgi:hypothetical protein